MGRFEPIDLVDCSGVGRVCADGYVSKTRRHLLGPAGRHGSRGCNGTGIHDGPRGRQAVQTSDHHPVDRAKSSLRSTFTASGCTPSPKSSALSHILDELDAGQGGVVVTPNLDHLRRCVRDLHFGALVAEADLIVADGMPLVWASRLQRTPLPERVAGSEFDLVAKQRGCRRPRYKTDFPARWCRGDRQRVRPTF